MKRFFLAFFVFVVFFVPYSNAEEKKTGSSFSSRGQGGMTYSPTEGWIKTGANQMQVGTDSMELSGKKKVAEEEKKYLAQLAVKKKADEEAAVKLKAEQEAKLAQAEAIIKANEAKQSKGKKKTSQGVSGKKAPRVLVA